MRELADRLLRPGTVGSFLAEREVVRVEGGGGGIAVLIRNGLFKSFSLHMEPWHCDVQVTTFYAQHGDTTPAWLRNAVGAVQV